MSYLIYYISILSPLASIVIGAVDTRLLWIYCLCSFLADMTTYFLNLHEFSHSIVSNVFLLTEFILLGLYFKQQLLGKHHRLLPFLVIIPVALAYTYTTILKTQVAANDSQAYNYFFSSFFYLLYIFLSVLAFYSIIRKMEVLNLARSPLFLACAGILLYSSGAYMLLLFKDYLDGSNQEITRTFWTYVFKPLNIIKNIFIAGALYYSKRTT